MSGRDRGEDRRRLLKAVRTNAESESASAPADTEDSPEPAPDGGTVALDAPHLQCASCDRTYPTVPKRCDWCGSETFVEPSGPANGDAE